MGRILLELRTIYKTYELENKEVKVLNNINLDVEEHISLAILGNIDSGKTSLIKIMARFFEPTFGEVELFPINKVQPELTNSIFHETSPIEINRHKLAPETTVDEMIKLIDESRKFPAEKKEMAKLIEVSGIPAIGTKTLEELEGSDYKKVKLISILANKAPIAFLDDVGSAFKYSEKIKFNIEMGEYIRKHKMTIIMTANDPEEVVDLCDEFIILGKGKIAAFGDVEVPEGFEDFSECVSKWVEVGKVESHDNVITWFKNLFNSNKKILEERRLRDAAKNQLLLPGGEPMEVPDAMVIETAEFEDDEATYEKPEHKSFLSRKRAKQEEYEDEEDEEDDSQNTGIETNNKERRSQMDIMKKMEAFEVEENDTKGHDAFSKRAKEIEQTDDEAGKRKERAARLARIQAIEGKNAPQTNNDSSGETPEQRLAKRKELLERMKSKENNPSVTDTEAYESETPAQRLAKRKEMLERIKAKEKGVEVSSGTDADSGPETPEQRLAKRREMLERIKAKKEGRTLVSDNEADDSVSANELHSVDETDSAIANFDSETPEQRLAKRKEMLERMKAKEKEGDTPPEVETQTSESEAPMIEETEIGDKKNLSPSEQRLAKRREMLERIKEKQANMKIEEVETSKKHVVLSAAAAERKSKLEAIKAQQSKKSTIQIKLEKAKARKEAETLAETNAAKEKATFVAAKAEAILESEKTKESLANVHEVKTVELKTNNQVDSSTSERAERLARIQAKEGSLAPQTSVKFEKPVSTTPSTPTLKSSASIERAEKLARIKAKQQSIAKVKASNEETKPIATPTLTTSTPVAPKPVIDKPAAPKTIIAKPIIANPVAPKPVPVAPKPIITKPVAPKPIIAKPVAPKPVIDKPVTPTITTPTTPTVNKTALAERAERLARIQAKENAVPKSETVIKDVEITKITKTVPPKNIEVKQPTPAYNSDAKAAARKAMLDRVKAQQNVDVKNDVKSQNAMAMIERIKAREGKLEIDKTTEPRKPLSIERQKQNIERIAAMGKRNSDFNEIDHIKIERERENRLTKAENEVEEIIKSSSVQRVNASATQAQHAEQLRIQMQELEQLKRKQLEIAKQKSEIQRLAQEAEMAKLRQINNSKLRKAEITNEKVLLDQEELARNLNLRAQEIEDRARVELNRIEKEHANKIAVLQNRLDEEERLRKIKDQDAQLTLDSAIKQAELVATRIATEKSVEEKSTRETQLANQILEIEKIVKQMEISSGAKNEELMQNAIEMKYKVLHQQELASRAAKDVEIANQKLAKQEKVAQDLRDQAERTRRYKMQVEHQNNINYKNTNVSGLNEIKLQKNRIERMSGDIQEIKNLIRESIASGDAQAMHRLNSLVTDSGSGRNLNPSQIVVGRNPGASPRPGINYNLKPASQFTPGAQATKVVGTNGVVMSNVVQTSPNYKAPANQLMVRGGVSSREYLMGIDKQIWESEQRLTELRMLKHHEAEVVIQRKIEAERQKMQADRLHLEEQEMINERKYLHDQQNAYLQNKAASRYYDQSVSNASYYPKRKPMQYTAGEREAIQSNKSGDINAYEYGRQIKQTTPYRATPVNQQAPYSQQRVSQSAQRLSQAFREANRPFDYEDGPYQQQRANNNYNQYPNGERDYVELSHNEVNNLQSDSFYSNQNAPYNYRPEAPSYRNAFLQDNRQPNNADRNGNPQNQSNNRLPNGYLGKKKY